HLTLLQSAKEFSQNLMKQASLRERVHALERFGFFEWLEVIQRRKEKPIGTVSVILQRRDGVRSRAKPLRLEKGPRGIRDPDKPVVGRPCWPCPRPALAGRAPDVIV